MVTEDVLQYHSLWLPAPRLPAYRPDIVPDHLFSAVHRSESISYAEERSPSTEQPLQKGTLYAIKCMKKDGKHRSQSPVYKDNIPNTCKEEKMRQTSSKSSTNSIHSESSDNALVHKVYPSDRPLRNNVSQRTECNELNDILAKWNVYKPKK